MQLQWEGATLGASGEELSAFFLDSTSHSLHPPPSTPTPPTIAAAMASAEPGDGTALKRRHEPDEPKELWKNRMSVTPHLVATERSITDMNRRTTYSETVTVLVGDEQRRFAVHHDLITSRSDFFGAAQPELTLCDTGIEKVVRLTNVRPVEFLAYLEFVYAPMRDVAEAPRHAAILLYADNGATTQDSQEALTAIHLHVLLELGLLWALGDFLGDHAYQNAVMDAILTARPDTNAAMLLEATRQFVPLSDPGSKLWEWLLDSLAATLTTENVDKMDEEGQLPTEFLRMLVKRILTVRERYLLYKQLPSIEDRCKYHIRPNGEKRCQDNAK
jgi:hypothetical protein